VNRRTQLLSRLVTSLAEIDAVTIDAYGTLLALRDPVASLARLLPGHDRDAIARAFEAEAEHYIVHSLHGRDADSLARLYAECAGVFNEALGSSLTPEEYVATLDAEYGALPGVPDALVRLRALGLELAVVGNWDCRLPEHLERLELAGHFTAIVTSAGTGAAKPDPRPFLAALEQLGVAPERALHVGDSATDEEGARAAGMRFAPVPLSTVVERVG
jgi:HAD superfamily hydrolase (TIGR01549 family)